MTVPQSPGIDAATAEAVATAFLRALARGGWADALALSAFASPPDTAPADFLRDLWSGLVAQHGDVVGGRLAASAPQGDGRAIDFAVRLATASVVLRIVIGAEARVTGFWITPPHQHRSATEDA